MSNCEQADTEQTFILALLGIQTALKERPRFLSFPWLGPEPKRNDRQAGHASQFSVDRFLKKSLAGIDVIL
jgi:hypothetical protein